MAAAAAFAEVDQCLQWFGFTDVQHRNSIIAERGFNSLNDFFETWPRVSQNAHLRRIASTLECDASSGLLPRCIGAKITNAALRSRT